MALSGLHFHHVKLLSCRQVGNAVPPPLSRAIGQEIKKCITMRMKQEQASGESSLRVHCLNAEFIFFFFL